VSNYSSECLFANEAVNYATTQLRCQAQGRAMCLSDMKDGSTWANTCAPNTYMWTSGSCQLLVQIYDVGFMSIVDPLINSSNKTSYPASTRQLWVSSGSVFKVHWWNDSYPSQSNAGGCGPGCSPVVDTYGQSCLCTIAVNTSAVFRASAGLPSAATILSTLFIGAPVPTSFGAAVYAKCSSAPCAAAKSNVTVWLKAGSSSDWDQTTIFQLPGLVAGAPPLYLFNQQSWVSVTGTPYMFRNPPNFMPLVGAQPFRSQQWTSPSIFAPQAMQEMEAYLDLLHRHPNVAPFVSTLLIQRLVTSNPSPRYVKAVSTAFQTGQYGSMNFTGAYGDLGATVTAIFLDQEATSPILEV
jgi:hypothetical protein